MNHPIPATGQAVEKSKRDTANLVIECLVARGWVTDRIVKNVVTKYFMTAVGPKQADIWISYDHHYDFHVLNGDYRSQGNNALAASSGWIPASASDAKIAKAVDQHLSLVEHVIGETYAARLLKRYPPEPAA